MVDFDGAVDPATDVAVGLDDLVLWARREGLEQQLQDKLRGAQDAYRSLWAAIESRKVAQDVSVAQAADRVEAHLGM